MNTTTSPVLRLQPGFAVIVALLALCGGVLHPYAGQLGQAGVVESRQWLFTLVFTTTALALIAVHEAGHVGAARLHGHRLTSVRVGLKFGVSMTGEHSNFSVRTIAAAGPVIGISAAAAVMAVTDPWSAVWLAAGLTLVENVANVALFFMPGSDGSKLVRGVRCIHADAPVDPIVPVPAPA